MFRLDGGSLHQTAKCIHSMHPELIILEDYFCYRAGRASFRNNARAAFRHLTAGECEGARSVEGEVVGIAASEMHLCCRPLDAYQF